jgi:hypothetical protein
MPSVASTASDSCSAEAYPASAFSGVLCCPDLLDRCLATKTTSTTKAACGRALGVNLLTSDWGQAVGQVTTDLTVPPGGIVVTSSADTTATPDGVNGLVQGTVVRANENCDLVLTVWGVYNASSSEPSGTGGASLWADDGGGQSLLLSGVSTWQVCAGWGL